MESGWLLRDGEVIASTTRPSGWRRVLVRPSHFVSDVGAIVVTGPSVAVGTALARLGDAGRLRRVAAPGLHVVGYGRHAVALRPEVAAKLRPGDELELRLAS